MDQIRRLIQNPAVVVGVVRSLLILLTTFGVSLSQTQQDATLQAVGAFLAIASLVLTGVTVINTTPSNAPVLAPGTDITVTTPTGQPNATGTVDVAASGEVTVAPIGTP